MWASVPRRGAFAGALALGVLLGQGSAARAGEDACAEPNDSREQACPIGSISSASGFLNSPDDVDRYRIEVGEGQTVQATLSALPFAYGLRLEAANGTELAAGNGGGTDDRVLGAGGLAGGTYFLVVRSDGGDSSADAPYVLRVSVVGAVTAGPVTVDPDAPPSPPAADRPLDQLVLNQIEAGEEAKASGKPASGSVDGAKWYEVTFKRDSGLHKNGPLLTINRVYRADDVGTAQRIFQEQVRAGLPEAKRTNPNYKSFGPQAMGPLAEEAQAFGAGDDFNKDSVTRHYRIVLRIGNLVETLYTYGPDTGNNFDVVYDLAKRIEKRINEAPAGPPPEIITNQAAGEIGLRIGDTGKETTQIFANNGADDRSNWYEARFERGIELYGQRLGPNHYYNKVIVATSNAAARAIYAENAIKELPEATEVRGAIFEESKTRRVGNETYAIGACNNDCGDEKSEALHERIVFRRGNVVVIVYIWGHETDSNPDSLSTLAESVNGRIR